MGGSAGRPRQDAALLLWLSRSDWSRGRRGHLGPAKEDRSDSSCAFLLPAALLRLVRRIPTRLRGRWGGNGCDGGAREKARDEKSDTHSTYPHTRARCRSHRAWARPRARPRGRTRGLGATAGSFTSMWKRWFTSAVLVRIPRARATKIALARFVGSLEHGRRPECRRRRTVGVLSAFFAGHGLARAWARAGPV